MTVDWLTNHVTDTVDKTGGIVQIRIRRPGAMDACDVEAYYANADARVGPWDVTSLVEGQGIYVARNLIDFIGANLVTHEFAAAIIQNEVEYA